MTKNEAIKEVARKRILNIEHTSFYFRNFNETKKENVEDWLLYSFRCTYFCDLRIYEMRYFFRLLKLLKPDWCYYNHYMENSTNGYAWRCWREDAKNER